MMEGAGSSAQALDLGENITHLQRLSFLHWPDGGALSPVLADVVEVAIAISNADSASIQIVDRETSSLRVAAQRGLPDGWLDDAHALASGRGTWALALERGHRIVIEDVEASPYFADTEALENQRRAGVRAVQSTPLLSRSGRGVGVLSTHYRTPFRPDAFVLALLDLLARQAADVIDRALLDQERRELERKYMALFHTSPIAIALTRMPDAPSSRT
ncbi:MAG: GAF domain-containing protein [Polyangiaceae bacterium]